LRVGRGISLAYLWDGECANISHFTVLEGGRWWRLPAPPSTLDALDVRHPQPFWDWTAIAYVAAGVALLVCLGNLLR
jgi:hypothetical protein